MNNAQLTMEDVSNEKSDQVLVTLRQKEAQLMDTIEALQNIGQSSFWKVLQNNVFEVELAKSKKRLEVESDTTEIFRLQGETRLGRRYDLDQLIIKYRNELLTIKNQLNG